MSSSTMPPPPDGSESGAVREKIGSEARSSPLFVRQALISDGGLYLDHLLIDEDIPAWREESFSALVQARQAGKDTGGSFPSMTTARWYPTPSPA